MPRKLLTAYGPDIIDRLEYGLKMDLALPQVEHYHLEEVLALLRDLREQGCMFMIVESKMLKLDRAVFEQFYISFYSS